MGRQETTRSEETLWGQSCGSMLREGSDKPPLLSSELILRKIRKFNMKPIAIRLMILIITSKVSVLTIGAQALTSFENSLSLEATSNKTLQNIAKDPTLQDPQDGTSGSISQNANPSVGNDVQSDASVFLSKDQTDSRLDQLIQAAASNIHQHRNHQPVTGSSHHNHRSNHQQHPNHQNYPNEPYPSASYTSSVSSASQNQQLDALLNRDHHQSTSFKGTSSDGNSEAGGFINSYGNQAPSSSSSYSSGEIDPNVDNYLQQNYGSLNARLIQNLTASLFPIKLLSNVTLSTLSELLNKTKHPTMQQAASSDYQSNSYRPQSSYNIGNQHYNYGSSQPFMSSSSNNYRDSQYNLLDYIRPNQFGYRDMTRYSQPSASNGYYRQSNTQPSAGHRIVSSQYPYKSQTIPQYNYNLDSPGLSTNGQSSGYKTSSNLYNTYMPYKEAISSLPTTTNGQALNMQLYDGSNFLDSNYNRIMKSLQGSYATKDSTAKLPVAGSSNYNQMLQQQSQQASNHKAYNGGLSTNGPQLGYHYIQQHNVNNQNHLDKIVYHSTPFRPSIVSPPSPTMGPLTSMSSTNSPIQSMSGSSSSTQHRAKMDNNFEKNSKLSIASSINEGKSDYMTNGQAINASKYAKEANMLRLASTGKGSDPIGSFADSSSTISPIGGESGDFDNSGSSQANSNSTVRPASPVFDEKGDTRESNSTQPPQRQQQQPQQQQQLPAPSMLLDLYEREIDNQIQEALYGEQHHLTEPMMGLMAAGSQNSWYEKTPSIFASDDSTLDPTTSTWQRPITLATPNPFKLSPVRAPMRHMATSGSSNHASSTAALDPLSAALQDLPTFSASDLQPVFPGIGPTYSLLPTASSQESVYSGFSPASLTSQMLSIGQSPMSLAALMDRPVSHISSSSSAPNAAIATSSPSTSTGSSSQQTVGGLLYKLQSSPLSSILASPLTHLYANLPRHKKHHSSSSKNKPSSHIQGSATDQHSHFIPSPGSLLSYYSLGGFAGATNSHKPKQSSSNSNLESLQKLRAQQQAAAAVAAATANLLAAASGQRWSPLQSAIIQAHAANAYLEAEPTHTFMQHAQLPVPTANSPATPSYGGLAGGGISPLIWRNILPSAYKTRKQSVSSGAYGSQSTNTSGQTTSNNLHLNNNPLSLGMSGEFVPNQLASSLLQSVQYPSSNPIFHNTYHGSQQGKSNGLGGGSSGVVANKQPFSLSSLLDPTAMSQLLNPQSSTNAGGQTVNLRKPRLKVKILKIPVAYYDNQGPGDNANLATTNSGLMSLFPSQLVQSLVPSSSNQNQLTTSATTSSLLASMPCPLSHAGSNTIPHSLDQHFMIGQTPTISLTGSEHQHPQHQLRSSSSSLESPVSIQGFSEINQPNDLQVSPTQTSTSNHLSANRLLKMLQWSGYLKDS